MEDLARIPCLPLAVALQCPRDPKTCSPPYQRRNPGKNHALNVREILRNESAEYGYESIHNRTPPLLSFLRSLLLKDGALVSRTEKKFVDEIGIRANMNDIPLAVHEQ